MAKLWSYHDVPIYWETADFLAQCILQPKQETYMFKFGVQHGPAGA